jgi:hypothetical protein
LLQHAQLRPQLPAFREKALGIWPTWNWSQVADEVRAFACGPTALGFKRGMNLAIVGDNGPLNNALGLSRVRAAYRRRRHRSRPVHQGGGGTADRRRQDLRRIEEGGL